MTEKIIAHLVIIIALTGWDGNTKMIRRLCRALNLLNKQRYSTMIRHKLRYTLQKESRSGSELRFRAESRDLNWGDSDHTCSCTHKKGMVMGMVLHF